MECAQPVYADSSNYIRFFGEKAARRRIPLSGTLELTRRCNLRCVHCYLGGSVQDHAAADCELRTDEVLALLDEITAAGCLNLLVTGGEPLLRQDFPVIYRYAKKKGLLVTVFTNATLVTPALADLFAELPPRLVEISVYGATAGTCEKVTGVRGSYSLCRKGIDTLLDRGVHIGLKTMLLTLNRHELSDLRVLAGDLNVTFRFDAAVSPCLDGETAPLQYRVPARDAVDDEFSDPDRIQSYTQFLQEFVPDHGGDHLYRCGAGMTSFHIDPFGRMQPCLMTSTPSLSLRENDFMTGWQEVLPRIREQRFQGEHSCRRCDTMLLCGYCPPFARLETGSEAGCSAYLCELGRYRSRKIAQLS